MISRERPVRGHALAALTLALIVAAEDPARAIVHRHDVPAETFVAPASTIPAVGKVLPDGEAVLIAPRWALTAGHVARGKPLERLRIVFGGVEHRVERVVVHRSYRGERHDLALVRLAIPVARVTPLDLSREPVADGTEVTVAGRGDHGDAERGVVGNDGAFRVATNRVAYQDEDRIYLRFDPDGPDATAREGITAAGDSGTPALVDRDGRFVVVGIGSMGLSPPGKRYGHYGSVDAFVHVPRYVDWIDAVLEGSASETE